MVAVALPPAVVTTTLTAPAERAGVMTVTEVDVLLDIEVPEDPPNVMPVTPDRLLPEIVTDVPPAVVPEVVASEVIVGGAVNVG